MKRSKEGHLTVAESLRKGGYSDKSFVEKRRAIYEYAVPYFAIEDEVVRLLDLKDGEKVLDIGCGGGKFLLKTAELFRKNNFTGLDISSDMFQSAKTEAEKQGLNIHFSVGDVQTLPFENQSFDRLIAMHMLYHVPSIDRALEEMARVVKEKGKVIITTNSLKSKPTLRELKRKISGLINSEYPDATTRFNFEEGRKTIARYFKGVKSFSFESTLLLTNSRPYVDYFDSTRKLWFPYPEDKDWTKALEFVRNYIQKQIDANGVFKEKNIFGIFVASEPKKSEDF